MITENKLAKHYEAVVCPICRIDCEDNKCQKCHMFYFPRLGTSPLDKYALKHSTHVYMRLAGLYV